jgi:hypothetical protein
LGRSPSTVGTRVSPGPPYRSGRAGLPHPAPASGDDVEALQRKGAPPVSGPGRLTCAGSDSVFGACLPCPDFPWPAPFPPSPPPREPQLPICSRTSQVLWSGLTSHGRSSWAYVLRLPQAPHRDFQWGVVRSPRFRCDASVHARGLRPRGVHEHLAIAVSVVWPSATATASAPQKKRFRGSMAGLHVPLSTLGVHPHERTPMTQGRDGSLLLSRTALSSATSHQLRWRISSPLKNPSVAMHGPSTRSLRCENLLYVKYSGVSAP